MRFPQLAAKLTCVALFGLLAAPGAIADTIVLKNGNVIDGTIVAETDDVLLVLLPSGKIAFPKRDIREIQRLRPLQGNERGKSEDGGDEDAIHFSGTAIFLKDGRRVAGRIRRQHGRVIEVASPIGNLRFANWMIDRTERTSSRWRFVRQLVDPEDRSLLRELRFRRMQVLRNRGSKLPEGRLTLQRRRVRELVAAGNVDGLREVGASLAASADRHGNADAARSYAKFAQEVYEEAGLLALGSDEPDAAIRAARLFAPAFALCLGDPQTRAAAGLQKALTKLLAQDPRSWAVPLELIRDNEFYGVLATAADLRTVRWRWQYSSQHGFEASAGSVRYRVLSPGGTELVVAKPPTTARGIASVWIPAPKRDVKDKSREGLLRPGRAAWWRIFWCPVERTWKKDTIPERLATVFVGLGRHLERHRVEERNSALIVEKQLQAYNAALDSLAMLYDPRTNRLNPGWDDLFESANEAVRELADSNTESLQRRAYMRRTHAHFERIREMLILASSGQRVDWRSVVPPSRDELGWPGGESGVLAVLRGFDSETRVRLLRSFAIHKYVRSPQIVNQLLELANDDFAAFEERDAAREVLQRWGRSVDVPASSRRKD